MDQFQTPITTYDGFGINPAYTTPAYMSNFRPAYSFEQDPYNPYAMEYPYSAAFAESVLPFRDTTTFASDPMLHQYALNKQVDDTHWDGLMDGVTKWGTPLAAWWAANKVFNRQVRSANPLAKGFYGATEYLRQGFFQAKGHTAGMAAARAAMASKAKQSLGARIGAGVGRNVFRGAGGLINMGAKGLGFAGSGAIAGSMGAVGATLGSAVGGIAIPLLAAQAAATVANRYVADPYISLRRNEDAMLSNTANTFVGGGAGAVGGGYGISATHAAKLAEAFTQSGTDDLAFKREDMGIMADYAMQQGLMNDIGNMNVDDMKKRVANMADTVKLIMAVANTDSVKTAIEYMGRLKAAGITDPAAARRTMQSIGVSSAMSGVAVEQLMNTVGNQGQLMFQSQGLLPVLGQKAAIGTHAGFANAYKAGIISTENLAMLGGVEGATQNSMQAFLKLTGSQANMMGLHAGMPMGANLIETMSKFGNKYAQDPFAMMGDMIVNSKARLSEQLASTGKIDAEVKAVKQMMSQFGNYFLDEQGNIKDPQRSLPIVMKSMGLGDEEIRATLENWKAVQNPAYQARAREATQAGATRTMMQQLNQEGRTGLLTNLPGIGAVITDAQEWGRSLDRGANNMMAGVTGFKASFQDAWNLISARSQGLQAEGDAWNYTYGKDENGKQKITRMRLQTGFRLSTPTQEHLVLDGRHDETVGAIGRMLNVGKDNELYGEAQAIKGLLTGKDKDWGKGVDILMAANKKAKGALFSRYDDETDRDAASRILRLLKDNSKLSEEEVDLNSMRNATSKELKSRLDSDNWSAWNNWSGDDSVVQDAMQEFGRDTLSEFMKMSKDHSKDEVVNLMFEKIGDIDMGTIAEKIKAGKSLSDSDKAKVEEARKVARMSGISSEEFDKNLKKGSSGVNAMGTNSYRKKFEANLAQLAETADGEVLKNIAVETALESGDGQMQVNAERRSAASWGNAGKSLESLSAEARVVGNSQEQISEVNKQIANDNRALGGMDLHFIKDFADATKAINTSSGEMGRAAKAMEGLTQQLRESSQANGRRGTTSEDEVMSKLSTTLEELNKTLSRNITKAPSATTGGLGALGGTRQ